MLRYLIAFFALVLVAEPAAGQARWLQHVQLVAPVEDDRATRTLLDSLAALFENESVDVRRAPDAPRQSFRNLLMDLNRDGLDITSANRVFVRYRLEAGPRGLNSTILDLHFIYRPEGMDDVDYPVVYVDPSDPAIRRLIEHGGTRLRRNEAVVVPFAEQISFANLPDAIVVEVGGEVIRDEQEAARERERLMATIREFLY